MADTKVLIVFPSSLNGGAWAAGPRVKPELVGIHSELRRAGFAADVLDLEVELGETGEAGRDSLAALTARLLKEKTPDLVIVSCPSAIQYTAAMAVGEAARAALPQAVLAVEGHHPSVLPDDFTADGTPFHWLIAGEPELAAVSVAQAVRDGERPHGVRQIEGAPPPLDAAHLPDHTAYPYFSAGQSELDVHLSRGCPYNTAACLLRPGGGGWRAYPPAVAQRLLGDLADSGVERVEVLDPAFGYDPGWRAAMLQALIDDDSRRLSLTVAGRPQDLTRRDIDLMYQARLRLRLEVGTLSREFFVRTGRAGNPARAVEHALDLLTYANAKGLLTVAGFTFNEPGETTATATETLDRLEELTGGLPNSSLRLQAESWAYLPEGEHGEDVRILHERFGTVVTSPVWWREERDAQTAAKAVVASREMSVVEPGSEEYWRPRFEELRERLERKLTAEARRGLRSHEAVGSAARGVPHGWLVQP